MRALKFFAFAIIGIAVITIAIGLMLPRKWTVDQTVSIVARPEQIAPYLTDFHKWQSWAFWNDSEDPQVKRTYSDQQGQVGSWVAWNGPRMGRGKIVIVKMDPASGVFFDEQFESEDVNAHGAITWTAHDGSTDVTWHDEGILPAVMGGYFKTTVERGLSEHFAAALTRLEVEVERSAVTGSASADGGSVSDGGAAAGVDAGS